MPDLSEIAKASVEEAFKDGVKARFDVLCGNLSGGAESETAAFGMFRNALAVLVKARSQALVIAGNVK